MESGRYYRVKGGQSVGEIEAVLSTPVCGEIFAGEIIEVKEGLKIYRAQPGDSYRSIAESFSVDEDELIKLNGGRSVYPTARIFLPLRTDEI